MSSVFPRKNLSFKSIFNSCHRLSVIPALWDLSHNFLNLYNSKLFLFLSLQPLMLLLRGNYLRWREEK